jgi:hypothetical protein
MPERHRVGSTAACVCICASFYVSGAACGGSQRSTAPNDAGTDSTTTEQVLGPHDPDPCTAAGAFDFQPIATFDSADDGLASPSAVYVSYDGTGTIYLCDSPGSLCSEASEQPYLTNPFLCGNCVDGPGDSGSDSSGACSGCTCASGNNAGQEMLPQKRCGVDEYGMHLRANAGCGEGLTNWGMNVGFDFRQNATCAGQTDPDAGTVANPCYFDATGWTGVSFWALLGSATSDACDAGEPGSPVALAVVADPNTSSELGSVNPDNTCLCGDPPCVDGVGTGGASTLCESEGGLCDPFGKAVLLVDQWQFYAIPFSEMRQKGYGTPETALKLSHLLGFKFNLGKGAWDVWLDDIAFYRPKGP